MRTFFTSEYRKIQIFFDHCGDHSLALGLFLLETTSDVLTVLPNFYEMILTQFDTHIKAVRFDNEPELNFTSFFESHGIMRYHSCVDILEQNFVVERKHQQILNVARSLIFQSNLPLVYRSDCILTTIYLIN